MLKCQGGCQKMYDEYYRMPDGKIFCEKCWRHGREIAEMRAIQGHNQRLQLERDRKAFEQKRNADQVRLGQLDHAIKLEKGKCQRAWSEYEEYYNPSDRPYNYEEVELLQRQRNDLEHNLRENEYFKLPSKLPFLDNTNYYNNARFISRVDSFYFETVTIPQEREMARKAELERQRAELERMKKVEEKQKEREAAIARHKAELAPIEEAMLKREKQSLQIRVKIAKETYREDVMLRCAKDTAKTVRDAVKQNPNVSSKVLIEVKKREVPPQPTNNTTQTQNNHTITSQADNDNNDGCGCLLALLLLGVIIGILVYLNS